MGREYEIHLSRSSVKIDNIDRIREYFDDINKIKNFQEFFDSWKIEDFDSDIIEGEYELTYNNDGELSDSQVRDLIKEVASY
jgi:hypothetical protein